jgi:hypothetical protein
MVYVDTAPDAGFEASFAHRCSSQALLALNGTLRILNFIRQYRPVM